MALRGPRLRKDDLRPGMIIKHKLTGQQGQVTVAKDSDKFSVEVFTLTSAGVRSGKTARWKVKDVTIT